MKLETKMPLMKSVQVCGHDVAGTQSEFAEELLKSLMGVRRALKQLIEEWGSPATLGELARRAGTGRTICWRIFRIVQAEDLAAEAKNTPSPVALKPILSAARKAGIRAETIEAVEEAAEEFQAFMKRHAGDRAAFESMAAGAASEDLGGEKISLAQRRAAYRAMSHIWGLQTDVACMVTMVRRPEDGGEGLDEANVVLQRGIRRLRPESLVTLAGSHVNPSQTKKKGKGGRGSVRALDEAAATEHGIPVIPRFCTSPLPELGTRMSPTGWQWFDAVGRAVGMKSSMDWATGTLTRNAPLMVEPDGRRLFHATGVFTRKPVETFVMDVLLHRPTLGEKRLELMVFQYMEGEGAQEVARGTQQFPMDERVMALGNAGRVELAEVPRYGEVMRFMAEQSGWALEEFDVYRVRIPYPVFGSEVRVFFYDD